MKVRGVSYFLITIMVIMLVIIGFSATMAHFESKLLPMVISSAVFVLAAIGLWREVLTPEGQKVTKTAGKTSAKEETEEDWRGYLTAGAWVVVFFLAIYLLGFIIAIPLFILAYMRTHSMRWLSSIVFAFLTPLLIYGIFERVLGVILYRGLLLTLLGY